MAYKTMAVILLVFFAVLVEDASGCRSNGQMMRCHYPKAANPEMIHFKSRKMVGVKVNEEELRMVPSGPDPLHHNGATPTKPAIP